VTPLPTPRNAFLGAGDAITRPRNSGLPSAQGRVMASPTLKNGVHFLGMGDAIPRPLKCIFLGGSTATVIPLHL